MEKIIEFAKRNKTVLLIIGTAVCTVLLVSLVLLTDRYKVSQKETVNEDSYSQTGGPNASEKGPFNPLINNSEVRKVEEGLKKQYEKSGGLYPKHNTYEFEYELSPNLRDKSGLHIITQSYAVVCVTSAPDTVSVFTLKTNYTEPDANSIAEKFSLSSPASSLPTGDGSSFEYLFSDKSSNKFLTLTEPSGMYYYHRALATLIPGGEISAQEAQKLANEALETYTLTDKTELSTSSLDHATDSYLTRYNKNYENFVMIDPESIAKLGASGSVCNVTASTTLNFIEILVKRQGGEVIKVLNNTRKIITEYPLSSQSLEDSVTEYQKALPIPPIVVGGDPDVLEEAVTIEDGTLVWYDYGKVFPQIAYVPMYLTSGTSLSGKKVFTLFPAVSKLELSKTPIPILNGSRDVLQLDTFNPRPPKPPTPVNGCYGNLIDYTVECSVGDKTVCSRFVDVPTSSGDPHNICDTGCKDFKNIVTVSAGKDPCIDYLEQNDVVVPDKFEKNDPSFPGGEVLCHMNGCPC